MIDLHAWQVSASGVDATMIMQVHDELVFEVLAADVPAARDAIVARMTGAADLEGPLLVEVGTGSNWDEAH